MKSACMALVARRAASPSSSRATSACSTQGPSNLNQKSMPIKSQKWLQGQSKVNEMAPRTMPSAWVASVARHAASPSSSRATFAYQITTFGDKCPPNDDFWRQMLTKKDNFGDKWLQERCQVRAWHRSRAVRRTRPSAAPLPPDPRKTFRKSGPYMVHICSRISPRIRSQRNPRTPPSELADLAVSTKPPGVNQLVRPKKPKHG